MGAKSSHFFQADRPESGGANKDGIKDKTGQHHYIPLDWVTSVDDKVHIDRPGQQAMSEWTTTPPKQ